MKQTRIRPLILVAVLLSTPSVGAETPTSPDNLDHGRALQGYDAVSYFSGKPQKGSEAHELVLEGVRYRFHTKANLETFRADPNRYKPAYGGWCAYAMAKGEKVGIHPKVFKIVDGRLMLFAKNLFANALDAWNERAEAAQVAAADRHWARIRSRHR